MAMLGHPELRGPFTMTGKSRDFPSSLNLIDIKSLSKMLSISKFTIYTWVSEEKIPHIKINGRLVRFDPEEIEKWINEQRVQPNEVWAG